MEVHQENKQEAKKVEEVQQAQQVEQTGAEIKEVEEEKTDAETLMVKRAFGLSFLLTFQGFNWRVIICNQIIPLFILFSNIDPDATTEWPLSTPTSQSGSIKESGKESTTKVEATGNFLLFTLTVTQEFTFWT